MEALQDAAVPDREARVARYFEVLHRLADGPRRTRLAVRRLEGWLLTLNRRLGGAPSLDARIDALITRLPDAKTLLRRYAVSVHELAARGRCDELLAPLGALAALKERFRFNRLFNEIILAPVDNQGRVDAVAIVQAGGAGAGAVFARRGEPEPGWFRYAERPVRVGCIGDRRPVDPDGAASATPVQYLAAVADGRLVVANDDQVRIVPAAAGTGDETVLLDAAAGSFGGVSALAVHGAGAAVSVAVAVKSARADVAVLVFRLGADGAPDAAEELALPAGPAALKARVNALYWTDAGQLWAVTGRSGHLLCWQHSETCGWAARELLAVGSPQYALQVVAATGEGDQWRLLLGGEDGVLRCFDERGRLLWARVLPGPVRGVSCRAGGGPFAPVTVVTEHGVIALYGLDGTHISVTELPGVKATALASGAMTAGEARHHLLGTLRGEVRLLEEVPAEASADPLLYLRAPQVAAAAPGIGPVEASVRAALSGLEADGSACEGWLRLGPALQEPLRAAWAARRLLRRGDGFAPVLTMLTQIGDGDDAGARELRAHVFGALGERLHLLPAQHHRAFIGLCRHARDGALASLITNLSGAAPAPLWAEITGVLKERVLEGCPFVSSGLLQVLARAAPEDDAPYFWLEVVLDEPAREHAVHVGFVQGVLGIVLERLGYGADGLLAAFAGSGEAACKVRAVVAGEARRRALFALLARHGDVLLRTPDQRVWRRVCQALQAPEPQLSGELWAALAGLDGECRRAPDVDRMLLPHLSLFPRQDTEEKAHWRPDALTRVRHLTDHLRAALRRIHLLGLPAIESDQRLAELVRDLDNLPSPSPLVEPLHAAWRYLWRQEIEAERGRIWRVYSQMGDQPNVSRAVQQVYRVMHEAGFRNGRYYLVRYVPGCDLPGFLGCLGHLELRSYGGQLKPRRRPPVSHLLHGRLARMVRGYDMAHKPPPERLIFDVRPEDAPADMDDGQRFWAAVWGSETDASNLIIPVIRRRQGRGYRAAAIFVFDLPEDMDENEPLQALESARTSPLIREALRPALCRVIEELKHQEQQRAQEVSQRCADVEAELVACASPEAMQVKLLQAAVALAGAEDGVLVQQSTRESPFVVTGATEFSRELFDGVRLRPGDLLLPAVQAARGNQQVFAVPKFSNHPQARVIEETLAKRFEESGKPRERAKEWTRQLGSYLTFPLDIGGDGACSISLRHRLAYRFEERHEQAVATALRRFRWIFLLKRLYDDRTQWIYAFVHEVRSDLSLVKQPLELMQQHPARFDRYLSVALRQVRKVYDLSQNMLDCRKGFGAVAPDSRFHTAGDTLWSMFRLYGSEEERFAARIGWRPPDPAAPAWQVVLSGEVRLFERVVRCLFDNAVKYGRDDVRVEARLDAGHWLLVVSNPGRMTPEEDALKFTAFVKPATPRHDGSHVGLAASLALAEANRALLTLENVETGGEQRVVATLKWPLYQSADDPSNPESD
jgi:signal transduction histidine kinase